MVLHLSLLQDEYTTAKNAPIVAIEENNTVFKVSFIDIFVFSNLKNKQISKKIKILQSFYPAVFDMHQGDKYIPMNAANCKSE
jgi:hypothetical protein